MSYARWLIAASAVGVMCTLGVACSDDPSAEPQQAAAASSTSGAGGGGGTGAPRYGDSACGTCVKTACADAIVGCQSDAECVGYLECLFDCAVGDDGNVEPACEGACVVGTSSAAQQAKSAIDVCRNQGAGVACPDCNVVVDGPLHPVLNQDCMETADPDPCLACSLSHCCESRLACNGDPPENPDCPLFLDCVIDCYDMDGSACQASCAGMYPESAVADFAEHRACMLYYCASEQTDCDASMRSECQTCLYVTCGDAYANFTTLPDGLLLEECVGECPVGDMACDEGCFAAYPEALDLYDQLAECIGAQCTEVC